MNKRFWKSSEIQKIMIDRPQKVQKLKHSEISDAGILAFYSSVTRRTHEWMILRSSMKNPLLNTDPEEFLQTELQEMNSSKK